MRIIGFLLVLIVHSGQLTAQRLHVIYACEQGSVAYGLVNLRNDTLMTQFVRTVAWGLNYPMTIRRIPKTTFTSTALRQTIAALKTKPNDIIVLYYSGFGLVSAPAHSNFANWRLADVVGSGLPVSEVEKWLTARNVRLSLVIADCSAQLVRSGTLDASIGKMYDLRKKVIQRLFLGSCGVVKLGSALPLLPSWANSETEGSVFTNSVHKALQTLLISTRPDNLSAVSFQQFRDLTETQSGTLLATVPLRQKPVLETTPCRRPRRAVAPTVVDPFAAETLTSLLTAFVATTDSLDRNRIRKQLLASVRPDAPVTVRRFIGDKFEQTEAADRAGTYPFATYLEQLRKPLIDRPQSALPFPVERLNVVGVTSSNGTQPIGSLAVRESWLSVP